MAFPVSRVHYRVHDPETAATNMDVWPTPFAYALYQWEAIASRRIEEFSVEPRVHSRDVRVNYIA